jgi:hypothetical protein
MNIRATKSLSYNHLSSESWGIYECPPDAARVLNRASLAAASANGALGWQPALLARIPGLTAGMIAPMERVVKNHEMHARFFFVHFGIIVGSIN